MIELIIGAFIGAILGFFYAAILGFFYAAILASGKMDDLRRENYYLRYKKS